MTEEIKRGPGRPPRAEVEKRERRRRTDNLGEAKRLAVVGRLDRDNYEYRWINDLDARLMQKTRYDDWDICAQEGGALKPDAPHDGAVRTLVGAKKDGQPMFAYLCRKPKELAEEDRRAKNRQLDAIEEQIKRGAIPDSKGAVGEAFYTPDSGRNTLERR
jgi:hypothetical protein